MSDTDPEEIDFESLPRTKLGSFTPKLAARATPFEKYGESWRYWT